MADSQYATLLNIMVLPGERYHCLFKQWVVATNHRQIELQLLEKDSRFKTIRSILHGAFSSSHPWITKGFSTLLQTCPAVMESFLPPSAYAFLDDEEDEMEFSNIGDHNHIHPRVLSQGSRRQIEAMSLPFKPTQNQWFATELRFADSRDYNLAQYSGIWALQHTLLEKANVREWSRAFRLVPWHIHSEKLGGLVCVKNGRARDR
jgi:hypothetical protein